MPERVLHRVEMIEIPKELIESMHRRQISVQIAQMVLAELARFIALRLKRGGDGRRFVRHTNRSASLTDGRQSGANGKFAGDEVGAPSRAAWLGVIIRKAHAFGR